MGRWEELVKMDPDRQVRVNELYKGAFPRDIRQCLSEWIECQDWDSAAADANKASTCFQDLLAYLDQQSNHSVRRKTILQEPNYEWFKHYMQKHFGDQPQMLATLLSECLREEDKILGSSGTENAALQQPPQQHHLLDKHVEDLKTQTLVLKKDIKSLEDLQEKLVYAERNWQSQVFTHNGVAPPQRVPKELQKLVNFVTQTKENALKHIVAILHQSDQVVMTLINVELPQWKQQQHMACVGFPVDTSLEHLQKWFTGVVDVLMEIQKFLNKLQAQKHNQDNVQASDLSSIVAESQSFTVSLLTKVLSNALVVEKQPFTSTMPQRPLILKTGVRFSMAVRFLASLPEFKCVLRVQPVFDKDVEEDKKGKGCRRFEFTMDDSKVLDMDTPDGGLVAEFGMMSITDTKGAKGPSKTRLPVTEELHIIRFVCEFQHLGLKFDIETSSLPLVVVSNANQTSSAWATIMWCSMLSPADLANLSVFAKPPQVSWKQLSKVLSQQFYSLGKRGLDSDQLSMLHTRIVGGTAEMVKWCQFKQERAWIWLDGILDLIKKHLLDLWHEGLIMGFVTKEKTQLLLMEKQTGTFLLRFSESIKDGAISFSYVDHTNAGDAAVIHVDPYLKLELETQSVPNVIYDYTVKVPFNLSKHPLVYLYPDTHKDTVFKRFYKESGDNMTVNGYVRRKNVPEARSMPPPPPSSSSSSSSSQQDVTDMETDWSVTAVQDLFGPELWSSLSPSPFANAEDLNLESL